MSTPKKTTAPVSPSAMKEILDNVLDFGPEKDEPIPSKNPLTDRIKLLVEQLEEINRRVDKLSSRF